MPTKVLFLTTYSHSTRVVGESNYQENIQRVIGFIDDDREPVREEGFTAELVLEDDNPYDSGNAVRIDIDGCTIGYLSRDDAAMYRRSLSLLRLDDRVIGMCSAVISGKWNDEVESLLFGVYLDLDTSRLSILRRVEESPQPHKTESSKEMQQEIQPTKPQSKLPLIPMKGSGCLYFLLVFPFVAVINLYILLFAGLWRGGQWLWKNATATPTSRKVSAIAAGILSVSGILYSAVAGFSGSKVIPTPTLDMVSLQNTAMAEAWIAYTQTMLANATDTPIPTDTLQPTLPPEERGQVAACLLFLSGMRPDALASIPRQCVDLPNRRLLQIPSMGIRTKNDKAAITYLLDIPDLFALVERWDRRVRRMAPTSLWYAPIALSGLHLKETTRAIVGRASAIGDDLRRICDRAGVEYKSPHKFRHGHIVYARGLASNMEEVKAISQNVMHANAIITDQVYSALTTNQVQSVITTLGTRKQNDQTELLRLIEMLKAQLT